MAGPEKENQNLMMAEINPRRLMNGKTPRLIDEWQIVPKLWDLAVRGYGCLNDIRYGYTIILVKESKMIATVSKWGNSLGIRIPSEIVMATGICDGDKVEITGRPDGSFVIQKKKKDATQLKAFGVLHRYANPNLIPLEDKSFGMAMEERYGKGE